MVGKPQKGLWLCMFLALALVASACAEEAAEEEEFKFGMILVGPKSDRGWSQAHFEAGQYVEAQLPASMIAVDGVVAGVFPQTVDQLVADMIDQGAQLVIATSDDHKDGIQTAAAEHPEVPMIWASGDSAWSEGESYLPELSNLGNVMGQMEFGKMIAGCAAALTSQTGSIGYLGPLINDETRRLVNAAFLGAQHCWTNVAGKDSADLKFEVSWIGFWFHIPGQTLDPTVVANTFFDGGADVVISGIDFPTALIVAGQRADAGEAVWAVPYDYDGACSEAPARCLGVPYFNWGPSYLDISQSVVDGSFRADFRWVGPDWSDLNNRHTSHVGWLDGVGLPSEAQGQVEQFIGGLAAGSINLFTGPLNWQDGSQWLADGQQASGREIWYTKQLLEGVIGASSAD